MGINKVYFDTAIYIYLYGSNENFTEMAKQVYKNAIESKQQIILSTFILTELLQHSSIQENPSLKSTLIESIYKIRLAKLVPIDPFIAEYAAELRVKYNLQTSDALHLATAILEECEQFVTSDKRLKAVKGIDVVVLGTLKDKHCEVTG
jgi:predicted nucleic acid-binding protein